MLTEDNDLAAVAFCIHNFGIVLKKLTKLIPFAIGAGASDPERKIFQSFERCDLGFELKDCTGRGCLDDNLSSAASISASGRVVEFLDMLVGH